MKVWPTLFVLAVSSAIPDAAAAAIPEPWAVTGTSTVGAVPVPPVDHTVEQRLFRKDGRLIARAGFTYLSRGDFYRSPGIALDATWNASEQLGIDVVSSTLFLSHLTATAAQLRRTTGLLPDSQKPVLRLATGGRWSFAYGKVLVEALDRVVHFDASATAHAGVLFTNETVNPGGDLGLALQARAHDRVLVWIEAAWFLSYEARTSSSVASGPMATIGMGFVL